MSENIREDPWAADPSAPAQLWTPSQGAGTLLPAEDDAPEAASPGEEREKTTP
jgi:hypothetical protein